MVRLRRSATKGFWLRGRYASDIIKTLKRERQSSLPHEMHELSRYIAASVPLHCADGWVLLARSASALLSGDWANAIHLSYYAELRATMSFLASQGIGVFDNYHLVMDPQGNGRPVKANTHDFAWKALTVWSENTQGTSILSHLNVEGITIADWLDQAGVGAASQSELARDWLNAWSLDLQMFGADLKSRNTVSYRPTRLKRAVAVDAKRCFDHVTSIWRAYEPDVKGSFAVDRHLLRIALEKGFKSVFGNQWRKRMKEEMPRTITALALSDEKSETLVPFFMRQLSVDDHMILTAAARTSQRLSGIDGALPVMARASLMLRLASAVCATHLRNAQLGKDALRFWWQQYGEDLALWETVPDDLADLWQDIKDILPDAEDWREKQGESRVNPARMEHELGAYLPQLASFHRACLWAIGIS